MLHCAIPTTAKDITDLINLLKSVVVMMFGISIYTKLCIDLYCTVRLANDLTYRHYRMIIHKLLVKLLYFRYGI